MWTTCLICPPADWRLQAASAVLNATGIRVLPRTIDPAKAKYLRKRRIVASVVADRIGNICGGTPRGDLTDAVLRLDDDWDGRDQIPVDIMRDRQCRISQEVRAGKLVWRLARAI